MIYFGERYINIGKAYSEGRFKKINWIFTLFSPFLWRIGYEYEGAFRDYHEKEIDQEGIGVVCIVFEKE